MISAPGRGLGPCKIFRLQAFYSSRQAGIEHIIISFRNSEKKFRSIVRKLQSALLKSSEFHTSQVQQCERSLQAWRRSRAALCERYNKSRITTPCFFLVAHTLKSKHPTKSRTLVVPNVSRMLARMKGNSQYSMHQL